MGPVGLVDIYQYIERAIKVGREFHAHRQYVVHEGEIVIVDEFTGRMAEGRKWSGGIHQAVEAKEGIEVTVETGHAARVTVQDLFRRYKYLSGMTGTASSSARELKKIYKLNVVTVPTNRPVRRKRLADRVYATAEENGRRSCEAGQGAARPGPPRADRDPVDRQVGTPLGTARRSGDRTSRAQRPADRSRSRNRGRGGQYGRVTVATNMAGRGTDIKLGEGVADLGGLHVICTEMHDSTRIDRQLAGRCGRQGDLGSFQQYLAPDDEILSMAYGPRKSREKEMASRVSVCGQGLDVGHLVADIFVGPNEKLNDATFAAVKYCCTTRNTARRCTSKWARTRISTCPISNAITRPNGAEGQIAGCRWGRERHSKTCRFQPTGLVPTTDVSVKLLSNRDPTGAAPSKNLR